jgi:hypothetical protein
MPDGIGCPPAPGGVGRPEAVRPPLPLEPLLPPLLPPLLLPPLLLPPLELDDPPLLPPLELLAAGLPPLPPPPMHAAMPAKASVTTAQPAKALKRYVKGMY